MDWTGLAAFVTSIGTLIAAGSTYRKASETRTQLDTQVAPKIDEMHDNVVNGGSQLPDSTPRSAPDAHQDPDAEVGT